MIFLSHANEAKDNEFTRWLALRLASLGYPVWCDQTELLGGEKFWSDIETAIRTKTTKFLWVLSRQSNNRDSVINEVSVAGRVAKEKELADFIIPMGIDNLPNSEANIRLAQVGIIDFADGWAPAFAQLAKKLERDGIPKDERFNPGAVAEWWRGYQDDLSDSSDLPELCASNCFPISDLPETIHFHSLTQELPDKGARELAGLKVPNYRERGGIFSFEGQKGIVDRLRQDGKELKETQSLNLGEFLRDGFQDKYLKRKETRNIVTSLLKQAWEARCLGAGLRKYELSGGQYCFWFPPGFAENDTVYFRPIVPLPSGRSPHRRMVARPNRKDGTPQKRLWHFAIQAKVLWWPRPLFFVRSHVIFTEDGELLPAVKQHSLRRSQCKQWYNDKWLNCLLAAMGYLHDPAYDGIISVPCGDDVGFTVATHPLTFLSPVSLGHAIAAPEDGDEEVEEQDDDDETDGDEDFPEDELDEDVV